MAIREISFASCNGRDTVKGWAYTPIQKPRAVVQLVHGFGEHSRRYLHMIGTMQEAGFAVYADDHIAHGKTAADGDTWGDPGEGGFMSYIEDEHTLRRMAAADYPGLPCVMFGHSWGSMIARAYAASHGKDLAGLLLCGVVARLKGADILAENNQVKKLVEQGLGGEDGAEHLAVLLGGMTERYRDGSGPAGWIANDTRVVADHGADPFNNLGFTTVQLIHDFVELYRYIQSDVWAGEVPSGLPVYLIAGDQDPCCNYGEGLYSVANALQKNGGRNIVTRAYTGYRHEIHNERAIRDEVEEGIIRFIEGVIGC